MSIRLRLAVVFALAAAAVFALGGWLFVGGLSGSLTSSIDSQLSARLTQADRYLPSSTQAPVVPGSVAPGEYVVQVLDATGTLRGASADAESPLLTGGLLARARSGRILVTTRVEDERERILAAPLAGHPGWVGVAGVSLEEFDSTISHVTREIAIGGALFVVAAAAGAYLLAGAALSPVERLRRQVAVLAERDRAGTVQVPGTRDEIAALARTMNTLLERRQRAITRQRALVADASHGLRTPFAVLRGELELAGRPGRSREELADAVARASEEVARLARITEQLLFLARSDEDRMPPRREPTDIGALLTASGRQAAARAEAAGVRCRVDVPAGVVAGIDPARIREAVDNLVDNALRYAPSGSQIVLTARAEEAQLLIAVSDAGPGFPPGYLPRAFERFARPTSGDGRGAGGAGLGLAIVDAIARAHGGKAVAANAPDGGAIVTIALPDAVIEATAEPDITDTTQSS
ncbi:MAG TPA: ATP-binding protein [Mycobacteriales bacterium]|nr:ATP-binding protein [Mycobacteriales bacterium]